MRLIYKILSRSEWDEAVSTGRYHGSPDDKHDGFIHFSTAEQVAGTLAKHFAGKTDLLLVAVDADSLGPSLKFEPSRGGALFPHLYGSLETAAALSVEDLPLGGDGQHLVPETIRSVSKGGA
ncbi:hypothetical protein HDIA_4798 [Hartmannibacter diazotrophicus]|uniref:Dihydroorotate dehydrogenase n=1 Tax=Hartmannibacter diazotrophicus TaxID=1482074 RepID=A0A2C9DDU9_9HYPH|nr:DUF952 domain-containing protein [Hartmannibacter diazotrophicus]SON58339.1 hypothetical protein HDIA_4798 [Hartmannibacter diazotrophicus]